MNGNLANEPIDYKVTETERFITRTYVYPTGTAFTEKTSKATLIGWPLFHMTLGKCPETGRRKVAKGWVAVGRFALGGIAVGQVAMGLVAVAQLGFGVLFLLAQGGLSGYGAVAQASVAGDFAYGQVAVARREAVGQIAVAEYAMGQIGIGRHVLDMKRRDPEAGRHFAPILDFFTGQASPPEAPEGVRTE